MNVPEKLLTGENANPVNSAAIRAQASLWRQVFWGPSGIRAGWRLIIYVFMFVVFALLIQKATLRIPALAAIIRLASHGTLSPNAEFLIEGVGISSAFVAAWIMSRIEKRKFGAYGIPLKGAFGKTFWLGVTIGLIFETTEMLAIAAMGGFSFGTLSLADTTLTKFALLWAVGFALVGIFEEFLFRGYAQFTLGSGIGFWPSAVLLSALFGAVHLGNPGEGWVGALSVMLFGIFASFSLVRTGNLWFAIGFHAATDYAETFIYSVHDSGMLANVHLLNSNVHGPRWLTGGTIGPEGSVINFALLLAGFFVVALMFPERKQRSTGFLVSECH
jgi:membrane protease YdiL (CAAX protease family)